MKKSLLLSALLALSSCFVSFADEPPKPAGAAPAAPAPAAPAAPAPAPSPAPAPAPGDQGSSPSPAKRWEDDLDSKLGDKPDDGTPAGPGGDPGKKPDVAPGTAPAAGVKPPEGDEVPPMKTNKELREWANTRHKEARRLENELKTVTQKMADLEKKVPKNDDQAAAQAEQYKALQKRIDDYEQKLRYLDYQKSSEYETKYKQPYFDAVERTYADVSELEVLAPTGKADAEGNPEMAYRPATKADFDEVFMLPLGKATRLASEKFKESAPLVLQHYSTLKRLAESANRAVEEYRTKGAEMEKQRKAQDAQRVAEASQVWKKIDSEMASNPNAKDWWGKTETDKEADEALAKGYAFADKLFSTEPDEWPVEDKIKLHVGARHRIAGFYKLRHVTTQQKAEIDRLTKVIEEMKGSAPGKPGGGGPAGGASKPSEAPTWEKGIDELPE